MKRLQYHYRITASVKMKKGATDVKIANLVNGSRYGRRPNLHNGGHENGKVNSSTRACSRKLFWESLCACIASVFGCVLFVTLPTATLPFAEPRKVCALSTSYNVQIRATSRFGFVL